MNQYISIYFHSKLGYCGIQYCACTEENSMSLAADEAGSIGTVGSNCEEDWVEIEGIVIDLLTWIIIFIYADTKNE